MESIMPSFGDSAFIFILALILFGPKKLPELGKGLGEGIKSFKDGIRQATAEQNKPAASATVEAEKKA